MGLGSLDGVRILTVDDSDDTREVLSILLGLQGAQVTGVGSAREALEAVDGSSFDVIICDISLPDGNGYELMRAFRGLEGGGPPAIAMTGYDSDEAIRSAAEAGYQHHLTKPIDFDVLLGVVSGLIGREAD
jgi:two-component system, chemotaxis family, CheB/CheR fusion protein